ncbi:MAG: hypothetical protein L0G94_10645 [Brachybacterium sp.]|uniref:hypothetical protein n=1 Tax=Brachybacterium sp. TaxID=1891286 RepID=UPI002647A878|nr:hypothetical protein [Brachybacterium sp.]MDN5687114.1 hypothetical protein [Brachybacterium sp.]
MLTSEQRRAVIREMKRDRPFAWPGEDELARQFTKTAEDLFGVQVGKADARVAVARGRFKD